MRLEGQEKSTGQHLRSDDVAWAVRGVPCSLIEKGCRCFGRVEDDDGLACRVEVYDITCKVPKMAGQYVVSSGDQEVKKAHHMFPAT